MEEIFENLEEIIEKDELCKLIDNRIKKINLYWGTAPTGVPSIGYFEPLRILVLLFKTGYFKITILLADLHAYLDSMKSTLDVIEYRVKVYEIIIKKMLNILGLSFEEISEINFIIGSNFQLTKEYQMDLFKIGLITSIKDAQRAGSEVVKQNENPSLTSLQYVLMQALDEKYLDAECQLGGHDQRRIMMFSRETLPKLGHHKCIQLMNKLIPGISFESLHGKPLKMSSSDKTTKISVLDSYSDLKKKINKTYCKEGDILDNTLLSLLKELFFPIFRLKKEKFIINRPEKYGGPMSYENFETIENDFKSGVLYPTDLKLGIYEFLWSLIEPIIAEFGTEKELLKKAYPDI